MQRFAWGLFFSTLLVFYVNSYGAVSIDEDAMMGIPLGGGVEEADLDLCPQGARVIDIFMDAWREGDYRLMYELLDDESKKDYPFEEARFNFQFLEFKQYRISSIRKTGGNFEFILSYGDWRDGDKVMKKMIISGRTFKIIMPTRSSPFKESAEGYF
ncbi:MAG: hypothetical protein DRP85_02170 [Candidatus Makaraimicrobium thalassicum]|nr:MAG: hypothetical protein DRP85_02170 [Candidatus Omnitrophota bacterium]